MRAISETKAVISGARRRIHTRSGPSQALLAPVFYLYERMSANDWGHAGPVAGFSSVAAALISFVFQRLTGHLARSSAGLAVPARRRIEQALGPDIACVRGASDATAS